jgi:hypothetical protein
MATKIKAASNLQAVLKKLSGSIEGSFILNWCDNSAFSIFSELLLCAVLFTKVAKKMGCIYI